MFKRGIKMKQLLEVLRLNKDKGLSEREISSLVKISKTTVHNYILMFNKSGLTWPLPAEYMDEELLSKKLSPEYDSNSVAKLDFKEIHCELKSHKKMTMQLLWEEYKQAGKMPYGYSHFANLYKIWLKSQPNIMRQNHKGGEKIFVDYSGDKVAIHHADGTIKYAEIFVGVLGASNYMYAEATWSQKISDWTMSHVRMFEHFGGVPQLVVSDNLKSAVIKPDRYDPCITPAYYSMLSHYNTAAMPARVAKPKDKACVENGVLIIQRWILASVRNLKFTSLEEVNNKFKELMTIANNRKFKKYPYTRTDLFNRLDKPQLMSLPLTRYNHRDYKKAVVGNDYHITLLGHIYSVPYHLVKKELDIWYTADLVECYYNGCCVAKHIRSYDLGNTTTNPEHMPTAHKKYHEINGETIKAMAQEIGDATRLIVDNILETSEHPDLACRKSQSFLKLAKLHGNAALEAVCKSAIEQGIYNYKNIEYLLTQSKTNGTVAVNVYHHNIRGANYYNLGGH
jgi:transposase